MTSNCKHVTCEGDTCRRPKTVKQRTPIKRTAIKKKPYVKKEVDEELEKFFEMCATQIAANPYCCECKCFLPAHLYRFSTGHILPKAIFASIATHPLNWLPLCVTNGCHEKSHRIDTFATMKCFPLAVRRFRLFENKITEKHKLLDLFKAAMICENKKRHTSEKSAEEYDYL